MVLTGLVNGANRVSECYYPGLAYNTNRVSECYYPWLAYNTNRVSEYYYPGHNLWAAPLVFFTNRTY